MCLIGNNFSMIFTCVLFVLCLSLDRSNWIYVSCGMIKLKKARPLQTVSLLSSLAICASWRVLLIAERNVLAR